MRPIRKIIFIEPKSESPNVYSRVHIPRTGAVLLATLLQRAGYEAKVYCEDVAPVDERDLATADVVGISSLTNTSPRGYDWADRCRAAGIPVVMGGTHASFRPGEALGHADFVVKGEGEGPLLDLLDALKGGRSPLGIPNLSFWTGGRSGRGSHVHNPNRAFVGDLDALPIPDFRLVHGWGEGCVASIMTSRGCPYDCTFCSVTAMLGRGYRYTSVGRVIEELSLYRDRDYVFFCDDNFAVNRRRTKEILRRKIEEGLDMRWSAQVRSEVTDDLDLLDLMRESLCFNVYVGFESFNPRTLALYNKRMEVERIQRSMEVFHRHGIKVHGMFVVGSDADDAESVRTTVRLAKRFDIDTIQFMILTPIPGTVLTEGLQAEARIRTENWGLFDGHYVTFEPRLLTPYELQRETLRAFRKFYSLGRVAASALHGDKWVTLLRLEGRRYVREWSRRNRGFLRRLKEELFREARFLAEAGLGRRTRRVALPEGLLPREAERFVRAFFGRLGVKVISLRLEARESVEEMAERAGEALARLRQRVDLLILPSLRPWKLSMAGESLIELAGDRAMGLLRLPLDEAGAPVYPAFARVGMVFTRRIGKVSRAFRAALEETQKKLAASR
ncbi:MAG: radical SAM protein [Candidatus Tectomicrobia bacterium]|uniref:Radical SAM protein n=1 Tax=Tectimicrobiota bacterium TaxID=2528274 RepID=A0A932MMP3_UNCTE|nr:radical SAM protein [Candidatus Tectomicrobia bacterium]